MTDDLEKILLKAKLELRNYFYSIFVRVVYEDVGQILSLVRMQVAFYGQQKEDNHSTQLLQAGELIARCIKDLRTACTLLVPEQNLSGYQEFLELTQLAISSTNPGCRIHLDVNQFHNYVGNADERVLLLYYMVTVCAELKKLEMNTGSIRIICQDEHLEITFECLKPEHKKPFITIQKIHEQLAAGIANLVDKLNVIEYAEITAIIINFSHSNHHEQFQTGRN